MPQIKTTDQSYVTDAGKPIVMAVPYSAYPQAQADWMYDNQSVPKDDIHTSADRTEYRLKDPKKSDEGRYKITIKNKHGEGEAFINLNVIGEMSSKLDLESYLVFIQSLNQVNDSRLTLKPGNTLVSHVM